MTDRKALSTLAVATITTGTVLVERFAGVGEAFEHILGHPVWTHEMPGLADRARALVLEQYPDFPTAIPDATGWQDFATSVLTRWGHVLEVERGTDVRTLDPIETATAAMCGATRYPEGGPDA